MDLPVVKTRSIKQNDAKSKISNDKIFFLVKKSTDPGPDVTKERKVNGRNVGGGTWKPDFEKTSSDWLFG